MHCVVAIPTFNRRLKTIRAIESALAQTYDDLTVVVVDDGSSDGTRAALTPFFADPRFVYIGLLRNMGTAIAKNIALALIPFDAITFHDSDDIADPTKVLMQQRVLALPAVRADQCLNWNLAGRQGGSLLEVGAALSWHWQIGASGERRLISRSLSLVDDFFPQLQMNAGPPGDWILINSGLFRRAVLQRIGGFENCIEEDRDLRNRLIMHGEIIWLIEQPLLTKIDAADTLTWHAATGYESERRKRDRARVWRMCEAWRAGKIPARLDIDLKEAEIDFVSNPTSLSLCDDLPMTEHSRSSLRSFMTSEIMSA